MVLSFLVLLYAFPLVLSVSSPPHANSSITWQGWQKRNKRQTTNLILDRGNIETIKVMSAVIDPSNVESMKNYHELKNYALLQNDSKGSLSKDFTICSTIFATKQYTHFPLVLLGKNDDIYVRTYISNTDNEPLNTSLVGFGIQNLEYHNDKTHIPRVFPGQWVKSCVAFSVELGSVKMVVDGILVHNITSERLKTAGSEAPTNLTGKIIIGAVKVGSGLWKSINSKVASIDIFSSALSVETMKKKTEKSGESCNNKGDYLNWKAMEWKIKGNMDFETMDRRELCTKESNMIMFPSQFVKMSDCMYHCQKLGGRAPNVVNEEQWQEVQRFVKLNFFGKKDDMLQSLEGLWMSVTDAKEEGKWRDFYTGEMMNFAGPFSGTGPNGGRRENCVIQVSEETWVDYFCEVKQYNNFCICSRTKRPYLRLRGLCPDSAVDSLFIPRNNDAGQIEYVSIKGSIISYNEERRLWSFSKTGLDITGHSTTSKTSYVLGKHNWTIENDNYECNLGKPYSKQLKLTFCREGQFTCNSGQCVRMQDRCNQLADCRDESDEENCQLLVLRKGYNRKIPPIVPNLDNPNTLAPVPVRVSITLLKIVGIGEVQHSIELQFQIEMEWFESRATYNNLNENSAMNVLTSQSIETMWLPLITYANTDQKATTRLAMMNEWSTHVMVRREGNLTRGGMELVDEVEAFRGDQNSLVMKQVYTKTFRCQYDFQLYPFDTQTCTIRMDASADDLSVVKLTPHKLAMNETLDMTLFKITSWSLEFVDANREEEGVWMKMDLKRKVMNELLTTFLPSILLMIITFATTFFKPIWFEAALSVNLTTMLMMTTISIGKMQTLPTTAYIRMIDVWLVFCQLVPFAEVILLTAQEYFRDEDHEEDQADITIVGSETIKPGPGTFVHVVECDKTTTNAAFKDHEGNETATAGDANLESSSNEKMQQLKNLGILNCHG